MISYKIFPYSEDILYWYLRNSEFQNIAEMLSVRSINKDTRLLYKAKLKLINGEFKKAERILKRTFKSKSTNIAIISEYLLHTIEVHKTCYWETMDNCLYEINKNMDNEYYLEILKKLEEVIFLDPSNIELKLLYAEISIMANFMLLAIKNTMDIYDLYPENKYNERVLNILKTSFIGLNNYLYRRVPDEYRVIAGIDIQKIVNLIKADKIEIAKIEYSKLLQNINNSNELMKRLYDELRTINIKVDRVGESDFKPLKIKTLKELRDITPP